ncbi:MAG: chorismate mutase [Alphaproteobacteria bacterium]|nr:chorismate mutase [Alphaproteobacteria bacterium SS10]
MPDLDALRQQIDEIDDQLHDLIRSRTRIVEQVREAKLEVDADARYMRPAREADIIRRLAERHDGRFPLNALTRIWREMISALTLMQGPLSVAVYAPGNQTGLWDVARDHYGVEVPLQPVDSAMAVLRALTDGSVQVGVLPWPELEEPKPWWPSLMAEDNQTFNVVGVLPFHGAGNARSASRSGMVIADMAPEATGDDRTLLALRFNGGVSRDRLTSVLAEVGLEATSFLGNKLVVKDQDIRWQLVEVAGFLTDGDERLSSLVGKFDDLCDGVDIIGAYATPMVMPEHGENPVAATG